MVIFGAAGELTKRLVVPALYNLANNHRLSEEFRLVGVGLTEMRQDLDQPGARRCERAAGLRYPFRHNERPAATWPGHAV
jgi:glucose-6-phosphate 1-dehydrogenase